MTILVVLAGGGWMARGPIIARIERELVERLAEGGFRLQYARRSWSIGQGLRLDEAAPNSIGEAILALDYRGSIGSDVTQFTGTGNIRMENAPIVGVPLLDETYARRLRFHRTAFPPRHWPTRCGICGDGRRRQSLPLHRDQRRSESHR